MNNNHNDYLYIEYYKDNIVDVYVIFIVNIKLFFYVYKNIRMISILIIYYVYNILSPIQILHSLYR